MRLVDRLRAKVESFNQAHRDLAADAAAEVQRVRTEKVQRMLDKAKQQYVALVSKAAEEGKTCCAIGSYCLSETETLMPMLSDLATILEADGLQILITDLFEVHRYFRGVTQSIGRTYRGGWSDQHYIAFTDGTKLNIDWEGPALVAKW